MIAYGELKRLVGNKPFVWRFVGRSEHNVSQLYEIDGIHECANNLGPDSEEPIRIESFAAAKAESLLYIVLVDYFHTGEESIHAENKNCTCEWIVVLQSGCQCGSIIPYAKRVTQD
jgi:hypothetical protein